MIFIDYIRFIDYLVNCIANGKYLYYQQNIIPIEKLSKIEEIDKKLIKKYNANKTKNVRLTLRRNNKARYLYVRYSNIIIVLKTMGESIENEIWKDIRKGKIKLRIGEYTTFEIGLGCSKKKKNENSLGSSITVTLNKDTLNFIKNSCIEAIRVKKSIPLLVYE